MKSLHFPSAKAWKIGTFYSFSVITNSFGFKKACCQMLNHWAKEMFQRTGGMHLLRGPSHKLQSISTLLQFSKIFTPWLPITQRIEYKILFSLSRPSFWIQQPSTNITPVYQRTHSTRPHQKSQAWYRMKHTLPNTKYSSTWIAWESQPQGSIISRHGT